jgi:hypothetical protein
MIKRLGIDKITKCRRFRFRLQNNKQTMQRVLLIYIIQFAINRAKNRRSYKVSRKNHS